jgi:hypothetical protein
MTRTEWDLDFTIDDDVSDALRPKSPEDLTDQLGIRLALIVLCIASLIAAIWFVGSPSFEKCSAVENVADRGACYEQLREQLSKPPAKGADIPR